MFVGNFVPIHLNLGKFLDSDLLSTKHSRLLLTKLESHK